MINTLIVDDEPTVIKWMGSHIRWEDYGCQICGSFLNAGDVLAFMDKNPVDLLITDVCMPDMTGLELIRQARRINPHLSILVISAHSNFAYAKEAIRLGVENYLLKPIDQDELAETLTKVRENISNNLVGQDKGIFRNNILTRWLKNTALEYNFKTQADVAEINLSARSYQAVVVKPALADLDVDPLAARIREALAANAAESGVTDIYDLVENHKLITFVICGAGAGYRDQLARICALMNQDKAQTGTAVYFSVGNPVDRYSLLCHSYEAARRYLAVLPMICAPIIFCEDYFYSGEPEPPVKLALQKLKLQIHEKNLQAALVQANSILDTGDSNNQKKLIAISIAAHIIEAMDTGGSERHTAYLLQVLMKYRTLHANFELEDWLNALINTISYNINEYDNQMHPHVRHCIAIIKTSSANPDLCLKNLSDHMNLSPAYLGQLFKAQTGKYFNDYLADVRLDSVYRMLMETDARIGEIAEKTGFTSQSYMNRLFKRKYKLSPNEYKRLFKNI